MLQRIRDNSSGCLAYAIVGLIAVVFALWGIGSYFSPSPNQTVATVSGSKISERALNRAVSQRYQRLQARYGEQFDPAQVSRSELRRATLAQLIRRQLVLSYARSAGYRISDADVLAALKQRPMFQANGQFSVDRYRQVLQRSGIDPAGYEAGIRRQLLARVVETQIRSHAFGVSAAVSRLFSRLNAKRQVSVLVFDPAYWQSQVDVSEQEIKATYASAESEYRLPPKVKLAYVALDANALNVDAKTSEADLRALYEQNAARFTVPAKRAGKLIRIETRPGQATRVLVQTIQKKLAAGGSLAAVADNNPAVYVRKVELTTRDNADPAVAQALFTTRKNELSTPVNADNAWFIVKPTRVEQSTVRPFESAEVQQTLRRMAKHNARREAFRERVEKLGNLAFQSPSSLDLIAKKMGLEIQSSGWISAQNGQGIGRFDAVRKAAFSKDAKQKGLNSDVITLGDGRAVVIRVTKTKPSQKKPLAEVRDQIVAELKKREARNAARQAARSVVQKLEAGETTAVQAAATDPGITRQQLGFISRSARQPDAAVVDAAFAAPAPKIDRGTAYSVTATGNGAIALVAVTDVKAPDAPETKQQQRQRERLAQRQQRYVGRVELGAFSAWLRRTRDVTIHTEALASAGRRGN